MSARAAVATLGRAAVATLGRCEAPAFEEDFVDALLAGLRRMPKSIPCKFFYDKEGSLLFEKICALPEYYPTRVELALLNGNADAMAAAIGPGAEIVEFGAGASEKIRPLLDALESPRAYLPIDISGSYLRSIAAQLQMQYPALVIEPIIGDFTRDVALPPPGGRRVGFFPGSTIGNFEPAEARAFLANAARMLKGGGLLIGVDLVKDPSILHAAYNDGAGVTAAFNKNLLARANREAGANFDLDQFDHYGFYNPLLYRIEIYLVSRKDQRVTVCGRTFGFSEGEAIHTEYSHKYTVKDFRSLAQSAGFIPRNVWCDQNRLFSIHWLEAP
ncbi:MAG TPA: L-histidine N(alpha)-methyltransferase [Micropepsaceae bacterium]|nr:L-histidine N(alpha)-methyltransferase [Micropepsaceae bacterium]